MKNTLWVEKYRPKTLADYVFRDETQRNVVEQWVKEKSIPHLLLSGSPGIGKCLTGDQLIEVEIDETQLSSEILKKLQPFEM